MYLFNDNTYLTRMVDIQYGIPQGSVLSPFLFILYINDLSNCRSNQPILFADDTCLTLQDISFENLKIKIESEIRMFTQWVNGNKLTLNVSKSNIVIQ